MTSDVATLTTDAQARAETLGFMFTTASQQRCPLHPDCKGQMLRRRKGHYQWTCTGTKHSRGLGELRGRVAYLAAGIDDWDTRYLSALEIQRWSERLQYDARLPSRMPVNLHVPAGASRSAQIVAVHIGMLVGLRKPSPSHPRPFTLLTEFTFAREFARAYCRTSDWRVRDGMRELELLGLIERAGVPRHMEAQRWRINPSGAS